MNKQCAKCSKTVYPVEQLRCLDKTWHKGCFTCQECGMTLTMKNYKGYNKLPYCNAHYPTTKHTTVADTPEGRRLAKQSKTQSQVEYHKAFVQGKGQKISVADDPETARAKKNTQNQSQIVYTGHQQTRAVSEQHRPEDPRGQAQRTRPPAANASAVTSRGGPTPAAPTSTGGPAPRDTTFAITTAPPSTGASQPPPPPEPTEPTDTGRSPPGPDIVLPPGPVHDDDDDKPAPPPIVDDGDDDDAVGQEISAPNLPPSMNQQEPPASPDDYDPVQQFETAYNEPPRQPVGSLFDSPAASQQPAPPAQSYGQKRYVALYDYTAADSDEVSFVEGDFIINWQHVDEGWMTGTVQRTNQTGMLPSNYVELE